MDKRQERITGKLQEAEERREEAVEERKKYQEKKEALDREKESILQEVKDEAEQKRRELMEQIRQETEKIDSRWRHDLKEQQDFFLNELKRKSAEQIVLLAKKALQDLADQDLEEKIADVFIDHLQKMDPKISRQIQQSHIDGKSVVVIRSVFDVSSVVKQKITEAVHSLLKSNPAVEYEHQADLLAGFRLKVGSIVIAWNLEEYLNDFQEEMQKFISRDSSTKQDNSGHDD
jgi:F-type H+-transporting ATPase subunit b